MSRETLILWLLVVGTVVAVVGAGAGVVSAFVAVAMMTWTW